LDTARTITEGATQYSRCIVGIAESFGDFALAQAARYMGFPEGCFAPIKWLAPRK